MSYARGMKSSNKRPGRRTQGQRREATQALLIEAVIEVIRGRGFAGLRARHVTQASGVTWGAVQHLFGDMNELLLQVAVRVSDDLLSQLDSRNIGRASSLRERVAAVVELIWALYSSPDYFAMVEIVRGSRSDAAFHRKLVAALARLSVQIEHRWLAIFADVKVTKRRSLSLCNIVVLTLSGLAARKIYLRLRSDTDELLDELIESTRAALSSGAGARK